MSGEPGRPGARPDARPTPLPGPLPAALAIGIDVMDRLSPRHQQGLPRPRTVRRILSGAEADRLEASPEPVRDFWLHWGAKEAAFKAVTLLRGEPPVFAHARFEVELAGGRVRYDDIELALEVQITPERLVLVARPEPTGPSGASRTAWAAGRVERLHRQVDALALDALRTVHFSPLERDTVRGLPSALARLAVRREAATRLGVDEARLAVVCPPGAAGRRPPYLYLDGLPAPQVGISISHDGEWVAWGVSVHESEVSAATDGS